MPSPSLSVLPRAVGICALAAALAAGWSTPAPAQPAHEWALEMPVQPLGDALTQLAAQTGLMIGVEAHRVRDLQAPALRGTYSADGALLRLLAGTDLVARRTGTGFVIEPAPRADDAVRLAPVQVEGAIRNPHETSTEGTGSYAAPTVSFGKGASIRDTPQSISVVTRQRIEDQNLTSLQDVFGQTPGVTVMVNSRGGEVEDLMSRGFAITSVQIDGASTGGNYSDNYFNPNLAMYDHVEVVRGADGLYSGTGEPGGTVNLVRKRPTAERQIGVRAAAGRWSHYQGEVDLAGPLALDGRLRGRMVGTYQDREFFYDVADDQTGFLYGIAELDVGERTVLTAGGSFEERDRKGNYSGALRYNDGSYVPLPRSTGLMADWNDGTFRTREVFAGAEHAFSDDWQIKLSLTSVDREGYETLAGVFGPINAATGAGAGFFAWGYGYTSERLGYDVHLTGAFDAFARRHTLLIGTDGQRSKWGQNYDTVVLEGDVPPIDVFDFDRAALPRPVGTWTAYDYQPTEETGRGVYAKLSLQLSDPLRLILGGRYGTYEYDSRGAAYNADGSMAWDYQTYYEEDGVFTPYAGLVYAVNPSWSLYASASEIHKSQASALKGPLPGTPLDPISGSNYEVGVKAEAADGRLNAALALYRIERSGEGVEDPAFPRTPGELGTSCCYLEQGDVLSQGVDVEVNGEVLAGWQMAFGYTYNDNENRDGGGRYSSVAPRHLVKVWSTWQLRGALAAWRAGAGVTAQSDGFTAGQWWINDDGGNRVQAPYFTPNPGYAVWNAMLEYRIDSRWSATLNGSNVFDKVYFQTPGSRGSWYGEPMNLMLTLRARW